jgi:putative sterol carrier protein
MTWQGGKIGREARPLPAFAKLKPLASAQDDPAQALEKLAKALSNYATSVTLHVRLLSAKDETTVEHWEIAVGTKNAKAVQKEAKTADGDVIVVMRRETWSQIAQGHLAPYEALFTGKLRVGGDFQAAKDITRHLSDPSVNYISPCS